MELIFLDTEFSDICANPKLISIGLVSECGNHEFYAELSGTYTDHDCSYFVFEDVIPMLQGGDVRMTYSECARRLLKWLMAIEKPVQIATDSVVWDWDWIAKMYVEASKGTKWPARMTSREIAEVFRPPNVCKDPFDLSGIFETHEYLYAVEDAYAGGLRRHHALDDAKAIRAGFLAWKAHDKGV